LVRAHHVQRADRTFKYCSCFRHGLLVLDLERSLVLAGEDPAQYRAHLVRFAALPLARGFTSGSDEFKLGRACAFASWRRLRSFRLQTEWALRLMTHHLNEAITARDGAGNAVPSPITLDGLAELGSGLRGTLTEWGGLFGKITRLNNRFDHLWCTLMAELGEPEPAVSSLTDVERARMRPSSVVENFQRYPAEVLGNPLLRPSRVLERLKRGAVVVVAPATGWSCCQQPSTHRSAAQAAGDRCAAFDERCRLDEELDRPYSPTGQVDYHLLGAARRQQAAPGGAERAAALPGSFEEFLALVERALGRPDPSPGEATFIGLQPAEADPAACASESPSPGGGAAGEIGPDEERVRQATVRAVAQQLWDAALLPKRVGEEENARLGTLVEEYGAKLPSEAPQDEEARWSLSDAILSLFRKASKWQQRAGAAARKARLALYDLGRKWFGKVEELENLVWSRDRWNQLYFEFWEIFFTQFHAEQGTG
ncbi:MAG TPA: hypothetical protein VL523_03345, partial [Terriglobia bacterium]|nr:hypothetical protein [Terriglobia bacterium]